MKAIETLNPGLGQYRIDRATTGAPVWPLGLTGSMTDTDDYVSAAVASTTTTASTGIDTERVMSDQQARDVGYLIASPVELECCYAATIGSLEALTLVFSAKESVFSVSTRSFVACSSSMTFASSASASMPMPPSKRSAQRSEGTQHGFSGRDPARWALHDRGQPDSHGCVARRPDSAARPRGRGLLADRLNSMRFARADVERFATWSGDPTRCTLMRTSPGTPTLDSRSFMEF